MIYINNEFIQYNEIINYTGSEDVIIQIRDKYKELQHDRAFQNGEEVKVFKFKEGTFKSVPPLGFKEGKKAIWIPFTTIAKSNTGSKILTVCQSAIPTDTGMRYEPRGAWFKKKWSLGPADTELIIFMELFCPLVKAGTIVLEDLDKEARVVAEERGRATSLNYYLYNKMSPIFDSKETLQIIAQAFGVPNVGKIKDINRLKNAIFNAVEAAEYDNSIMGVDKFVEMAKGSKLPVSLKMRALVQDGIDKNIIYFDDEDFRWKFSTTHPSRPPKEIMMISPSEADSSVDILVKHLQGNEKDYELILRSCNPDILIVKDDEIEQMEKIPEEKEEKIQEDFVKKEKKIPKPTKPVDNMSYRELQTYAKKIGLSVFGMKKAALLDMVKEILG